MFRTTAPVDLYRVFRRRFRGVTLTVDQTIGVNRLKPFGHQFSSR